MEEQWLIMLLIRVANPQVVIRRKRNLMLQITVLVGFFPLYFHFYGIFLFSTHHETDLKDIKLTLDTPDVMIHSVLYSFAQ